MPHAFKAAGAAVAIVFCFAASPAMAQDGLAGLHDQVRIGNKVCMADHFHSGSSSGMPSKKAAEMEAIRSWAGFTAWEYGNQWGSFAMAESRRVQCQQSGGAWSCNIEARPCRRR